MDLTVPQAQEVSRESPLATVLSQGSRLEVLETGVCAAWGKCYQDIIVVNEHGTVFSFTYLFGEFGVKVELPSGEVVAKIPYQGENSSNEMVWQVLAPNEDLIGAVHKTKESGWNGSAPALWSFREMPSGTELLRTYMKHDVSRCGVSGSSSIINAVTGVSVGQVDQINTGCACTDRTSVATNSQLATSNDRLMAVTISALAIRYNQSLRSD